MTPSKIRKNDILVWGLTSVLVLLILVFLLGFQACGSTQIGIVTPMPEGEGQLIREGGEHADPTAGRNIYKNEKYGYTFIYPADCYFGRMPRDCKEKPPEERRSECLCFLDSTNPGRIFMQAYLGYGDQLSLAEFTVSHHDSPVFNPPQGTDLNSWIKENFSEMFEEIPDEPNMELGGIPAVRVIYPGSPQSPGFEDIYYFHNDILFQIRLLNVDNENNVKLYDQMLSTFRLEE